MTFKIILLFAAIAIIGYAESKATPDVGYLGSRRKPETTQINAELLPLIRNARSWFASSYYDEEPEKPSETDKKLTDIANQLNEIAKLLKEKNSAPQSAPSYAHHPAYVHPVTRPSSGQTAHPAPANYAPPKGYEAPEASPTPAPMIHTIRVEVAPCTKDSEANSEKPVAPSKPAKPERDAEKPATTEKKPSKPGKDAETPAVTEEKPPKTDKDSATPEEPKPMGIPKFPDETESKDPDVAPIETP